MLILGMELRQVIGLFERYGYPGNFSLVLKRHDHGNLRLIVRERISIVWTSNPQFLRQACCGVMEIGRLRVPGKL